MSWIDLIKPFTNKIIIQPDKKSILLVHPHFTSNKSKADFKKLLLALKQNEFRDTTVECIGSMNLKGLLILNSIKKYLLKHNLASSVDLNFSIENALYNMKVKFN